jgi:hypothetical protein
MLPWSKNVGVPLEPIKASDFNLKTRAFPFEDSPSDEKRHRFIEVNSQGVYFKLQAGPIQEVGVNGCQIDDMVKFVTDTIRTFNEKFPCRENALAITKLEEASLWLMARQLDREARKVEGLSKP